MSQVIRVGLRVSGGPAEYAHVFGISSTLAISNELQVTTGTSNSALPVGGLTAIDIFYFVADQAVTLKFESTGGTSITVDANKPVLLSGTNLTAIYISNSSGSTANVKYFVAGA